MPGGGNIYGNVFQDRTTTIMLAAAAIFAAGSVGWLVYAVVQKRMNMADQANAHRILTTEEKKAVLEQLAARQPTKEVLTEQEKLHILNTLSVPENTAEAATNSTATQASVSTAQPTPQSSQVTPPPSNQKSSLSAEEKLRILQDMRKQAQ